MTVAPRYESYPGAVDTGLDAPVLLPLPGPGGRCAYAPARLFLETRAGVARVFVGHPAFEAMGGDIYGTGPAASRPPSGDGSGGERRAGGGANSTYVEAGEAGWADLDVRHSILCQAALAAPGLLWGAAAAAAAAPAQWVGTHGAQARTVLTDVGVEAEARVLVGAGSGSGRARGWAAGPPLPPAPPPLLPPPSILPPSLPEPGNDPTTVAAAARAAAAALLAADAPRWMAAAEATLEGGETSPVPSTSASEAEGEGTPPGSGKKARAPRKPRAKAGGGAAAAAAAAAPASAVEECGGPTLLLLRPHLQARRPPPPRPGGQVRRA